jgi:GxxExxY protein
MIYVAVRVAICASFRGMLNRINDLSYSIIGCAIEVHRILGPGMLESTYQKSLEHELTLAGLRVDKEVPVALCYKSLTIERAYFIDLLVEDLIVVELKVAESLRPEHEAQTLTYLKHGGYQLGLLINFNEPRLKSGIRRVVNNLY